MVPFLVAVCVDECVDDCGAVVVAVEFAVLVP